MTFSVVGQGENRAEGVARVLPFGPSVTAVEGDKLIVRKDALRERVKESPLKDTGTEEWSIRRLIEQIKALIARIARFFGMRSGPAASEAGPPRDGEGSGHGDGDQRDDAVERARQALMQEESEDELTISGLPAGALDRVRSTIDGLVNSSVGKNLPESLKAALAMPELAQSSAPLRVLLQTNCDETKQVRMLAEDLRTSIATLISPYATRFELTEDEALAVFLNDMRSGGGAIANVADPRGELRGHVVELERLETALASLAKARGQICGTALDAGVYDKNELADLLEKYGVESEFLADLRLTPTEVESADNVVSLSAYRSAPPTAESLPVHLVSALQKLEKAGHLSVVQRSGIERAAEENAVLASSDPFDIDMEVSGDDLSDFGIGRSGSPKLTS